MMAPRGLETLLEIERAFVPASEYNKLLFTLYLTYLRRYKIDFQHIPQAKKMSQLLHQNPWPVFTSWQEVMACSRLLKFNPRPRCSLGCPILKIGYMLQEIGVLPPKALEAEHLIANQMKKFNRQSWDLVNAFVQTLKKNNRAQGTVYLYLISLIHLQNWLLTYSPTASISSIDSKTLETYLNWFATSHPKPHYNYSNFCNLRNFFAWCQSERKILHNPCKFISVNKPAPKITICSETQIQQLTDFIKNPHSDPQNAMILALSLFFGFTSSDLIFATLQPQAGSLGIVLHRRPKTYHRKCYNREQLLALPHEPLWFLQLQKRFYTFWLNQYKTTRKTYPRHSLILPLHGYYNRPISREWIRKHFQQATREATGIYVPVAVLRKTCGHLYSQNGDASILSRLGWSRRFSFDYTWQPREYFVGQEKI